MNGLYQELLMDHYRHPRNRGIEVSHDFISAQHNPSCGDSVQCAGVVREGKIVRMTFDGAGCVISQATASMLSEAVVGKTLEEVLKLDAEFVLTLIGMPLGPTRLRCALLALYALKEGIQRYAHPSRI